MPRVPKPRPGIVLEAKARPLPFSFFPVTRTNRRYGLYDTVFAVTPWTVMRAAVNNDVRKEHQREALAFLEQAEDFYAAATSGISTNPLLTYYSFMNLAKVLIRARGYHDSLDRAMHGLKEETAAGGTELEDSKVLVKDSGSFHEVVTEDADPQGGFVCLEQIDAVPYTGRPTDVVVDLVEMMKARLWRIVSSIPGDGYRRYYLYPHPSEETGRIPQLGSMWALTFYFGSVVRYRPHLFDEILRGPHGAFVAEFISSQTEQMLYLFASELCRREIARPAIV